MVYSCIKYVKYIMQVELQPTRKHWIIRVGDGENLKKSKHPFWGIRKGGNNLCQVKKINQGDVLWFLSNKLFGGKIIGMAEYTHFVDADNEPLIQIDSIPEEKQEWSGNISSPIQLFYTNFYDTQQQSLSLIIQCAASIMNYDRFIHTISLDLKFHYINFKFYALPKQF